MKDENKIMPYEESVNDGHVLIFLHGFPDNHLTWKNQIRRFRKHYHIVNFNLPGSWNGNVKDKKKFRPDFIIQTIKKKIEQIAFESPHKKFVLIGHDIGACILHEVGREVPIMVEGEILISGMSLAHFVSRYKSPLQVLKSFYIFLFQLPYVPDLISKLKSPNKEAPHGLSSIYLYQELSKGIPLKELCKSPVRTLLIFGNHDPFLNVPTAEELEKFYTHAELITLKGGHWIQNDRSVEVNEIMNDFISEVCEEEEIHV